jgi:hypothetical protein
MQTTSPSESQVTVNTDTNQLGKICLSIFLLLGKEDAAIEINFFNTMIYKYFSLKQDLILNG